MKDLDNLSKTKDVDSARRTTDISATWNNVFADEANAMSHFKIALGTDVGGVYYQNVFFCINEHLTKRESALLKGSIT